MAVAAGVAIGVAAAAVAGAAITASAAKSAAKTQANAAQAAAQTQSEAQTQAINEQARQFDISQENLQPYRTIGTGALREIAKGELPGGEFATPFSYPLSAFEADPGYQFRVSEGMKAVERSAAARGGLNSGRTLKELTRYWQNVASSEYNTAYTRAFNEFMANRANRFNQLASLAGIGQVATTTGAQIGLQTGQNVSNIYQNTGARIADIQLQAGNARAAGQIGATSPYSSLLSGVGNAGLQYLAFQNNWGSNSGVASPAEAASRVSAMRVQQGLEP